jgi:hypothetical protein
MPEKAQVGEDQLMPPPIPERIGPRLWTSLLFLYVLFVLLRFLQSLLLSEPAVIPDELVYKSMALGFYKWLDPFVLRPEAVGAPTNVGYVLYQILIAFIFFFRDNFLVAGKLFNAFLINATLFPLYGILRDFVPRREAALGAALALLLPSFGYSSFLMAENLYTPLFALCIYLIYRSCTGGTRRYALLTGFCLVLCFLTKPHALVLLTALLVCGCALAAFSAFKEKDKSSSRGILLNLGTACAVLAASLVAFIVIFGGGVARSAGFNLAVTRGIPSRVVSGFGGEEYVLSEFLTMAAAHLGSVLFLFLPPLLLTFWGWARAFRERDTKRLAFASLVLFLLFELAALILITSLFFAPEESFVRLHGRFYSMVFPLLIISCMAFRRQVRWTGARRILLLSLSLLALLALLPGLPIFFGSPVKFSLAIDFPEVAWAAFLPRILVAAVVLLFIGMTIQLIRKGQAGYYLGFFVLVALLANGAESWILVRFYEPQRVSTRPDRTFIRDTIRDPDSRVAVVDPGEIHKFLAVFWLPYDFTYAARLPEHTTLERDEIPQETDFVVLFGEYRLDFQPIRSYRRGRCRILRLAIQESVIRDFRGVSLDAPEWGWTEQEFAYFSEERFERLVLTLNDWQPYYPQELTIRTNLGSQRISLNRLEGPIKLPYSRVYRFSLDRTFNPRELGINPEDDRELGISIRSAVIEFQ